jgi:hypothetical protein
MPSRDVLLHRKSGAVKPDAGNTASGERFRVATDGVGVLLSLAIYYNSIHITRFIA